MKTIDLIVPTILETQLTGFIGAVEKTYRGKKYRAEIWRAGWVLYQDGTKLGSWDDLPAAIQETAREVRDILMQAQAPIP